MRQEEITKLLATDPQAYLKAEREREQKLSAVGSPYLGHVQGKNGAWNIPTIDESIYFDYTAGLITIREAAIEWAKAGWTNFIDESFAREKIADVDKKYHRIDYLSIKDGLDKLMELRKKLEASNEDIDPIEVHHLQTEICWLEQKYVEDLPF